MLRTEGDALCGHLRCAKRSSAALRTALQLEEDARNAMLNSDSPTSSALVGYDNAAVMAKLRRDVKSSYEQTGRAVACGDQALVKIQVLGRVVRIFGATYALCGVCAVLTLVGQENRFQGEICCQRCDEEMLTRDRPQATEAFRTSITRVDATRRCRYCGKQDTSTELASKWKSVPSPLDGDGANADVPAPLRTVIYCPTHFKPWLAQAHLTLDTRVIFSHLAAKARPIVGANTGAGGRGYDAVEAEFGAGTPVAEPAKPKKQRRVRSLKNKT